jgi:hypothetical protein
MGLALEFYRVKTNTGHSAGETYLILINRPYISAQDFQVAKCVNFGNGDSLNLSTRFS